jgi:NADPH-dependent 7-cyano-7-deazaguanine reductase QueF
MIGLSVPCADEVRMSAEFTARHLCPFRDEIDDGTVTVSWITSHGVTFELHALADAIGSREHEQVSHEQWTAGLAHRLAEVDVAELAIVSTWTTAGATIIVGSVHPGSET